MGKTPAPPRGALSSQVYDDVRAMCELRLGRSRPPKKLPFSGKDGPGTVSVEVIILCLKRIRKSIKLWSKQGGRQGYLYYMGNFMG